MPLLVAVPICLAVLLIGTWAISMLLQSGGMIESKEAREFREAEGKEIE